MYGHKGKAKISIKSHHVLQEFKFVQSINGKEKAQRESYTAKVSQVELVTKPHPANNGRGAGDGNLILELLNAWH
ncbi:hypothetical protein AV530_004767 [Patagioenas fasciata monilis]|uniref:Uncharacterized protein n=1 Tax=Patagioenas fasciata monilis TaxID=372326 RepID=A0A1V4KFJ5_PATFA|nr:hypothetical protein AV530_004767 [Patagioenas fasciata monilis]